MPEKIKAAVYARTSIESKQMKHSILTQIEYFKKNIEDKPDWTLVDVYVDSGASGTRVDKRKEFQRMIEDCEAGKIDVILVKSISRFARNTLDLLRIVRHLKTLGISVRFEEQNIDSLTEEGELMLTLMASMAQAESESISESVKWSIRKAFEKGIGNTKRRTFGYHWVNGKQMIIPEEAEAVRKIFTDFLAGCSHTKTAEELNQKGITSIHGNPISVSLISKILRNITYTGNTLLQKTYIQDPISKKKKTNKGELPQYFVRDSHEAIIDMDMFKQVQKKLYRGWNEWFF